MLINTCPITWGGGGGYSTFRMALSIISEYGGLIRRGAYIRGGGGAYIWRFMVANKYDKLFIEAFKKYV